MTKRAAGKFERVERGFYATPREAVLKLLPHIQNIETFAEPMCGDGAIVRALEPLGWRCHFAMDLEPQGEAVAYAGIWDVMMLQGCDLEGCDAVISNPPWPLPARLRNGLPAGYPTVQIIQHLASMKPTWLLLSADFAHNGYFLDLAPICSKIVSAGRVKWIAGSSNTGYDNAAWYLFEEAELSFGTPRFYGNAPGEPTFHRSIGDVL